ncbi:hypothetical protein ABBQ38_005085 [Trebouxia sp. C0009 RCD-2024]
MTRSRKHKSNRQQDQHGEEGRADTSTPKDSSYPPPPGPPIPPSTAAADVVDVLHPQTTQASFLRLTSGSSRQGALTTSRADPDASFVEMPDCSTFSDPLPAVVMHLPISHAASISSGAQPTSSLMETPQPALPSIAVHARAGNEAQTSTHQQSFTISAAPGSQKLYYLWSPRHEQQDAAGTPGPSYTEAFDHGKRKLLNQGSSPFADVTKQQVARMATWEPDPADSSHARKHMRPWWIRLFSPWPQTRKGDAEAIEEGDSKGVEQAMPSWRWKLVVFLCCLVAMICYVDRAAMSIAIIPMSLQYGWSNSVKGAINSVFFVGYTVTNICGGYLATRFTAKLILGLGVVVWSIFTILTPVAAATKSVYVVLACRCLMGAGEGVTFPSIQHLQGKWCPASRRTFANTLIFAGATSGTILSYASAPAIIARYNWPGLFVIYGSLGLLWCMFWIPLVKEEPKSRMYPHGEGIKGVGDVPWESFARSSAVWAIFVAQCTQGVMHFLVFLWIPSYYNQNYGIDLKESATLSVFPWCCAIVATMIAGAVADALNSREVLSLTQVRKVMQGIGSFGPAGCLFYLAWLDKGGSAAHACVVLSVMLSLEGCYVAGAASNHLDLSAKFAGIIFGLTNGLSSIVEAFSVYGTGLILDSKHSWPLVFQIVAGINVLGGLFYICFASSKPQLW